MSDSKQEMFELASLTEGASASLASEQKLPGATSARWQPLRSGLCNVFKYDYEEFWFERGRLLLRGNNGTGKSRILALTLPFLFDGEVASHRVEPDGDPAKRIEWNLLMNRYSDRLGYTWIEFGRRGADGSESYLTLGCGLSAVEGRGLVGKWFFLTDRRIGESLFLQNENAQPLTKGMLEKSLAGRGEVFTSARSYRQAVDQALFKLGEQRYQALVNLLIQLRQPQLSRQLDERRLSDALGEALMPVNGQVINDLAESFRGLEAERAELDSFVAAHEALERFLREYSVYAQVAARRRSDEVRGRQSAYEAAMRSLRAQEVSLAEATSRWEDVSQSLVKAETEEIVADEELRALEASPHMQSVRDLDLLKQRVEERTEAVKKATENGERAQRIFQDRQRERALESERFLEARKKLAASDSKCRASAAEAGLLEECERLLADITTSADSSLGSGSSGARASDDRISGARLSSSRRQAWRGEMKSVVEAREKGLKILQSLNRELEQVERELTSLRQTRDEKSAERDNALELEKAAHSALQAHIRALLDRYQSWRSSLNELIVPDVDELRDALLADEDGGEVESADLIEGAGLKVLPELVRKAEREAWERIQSLSPHLLTELKTLEDQRAETEARLSELRAGTPVTPDSPPTRDPSFRAKIPGQPFWALCDFKRGVDRKSAAGFEAALEASGLLDAWVAVDGRLLAPGEHDTVLLAPGPVKASREGKVAATLADVLEPVVDPSVAAVQDGLSERIAVILSSIHIGKDAGELWVADDGSWRLGTLHGRWHKDDVQHIGRTNREVERKRRIVEHESVLQGLLARQEELRTRLEELRAREWLAKSEADRAPIGNEVQEARNVLALRQENVLALTKALAEKESAVMAVRERSQGARAKRDASAIDLGLFEWVEDLEGYGERLRVYRQETEEFAFALERAAERAQAFDRAEEALSEAGDRSEQASNEARDREVELLEARTSYETLHRNLGGTIEGILAQLAEARERLTSVRRNLTVLRDEHGNLRSLVAVQQSKISSAHDELEHSTRVRDEAVARWSSFGASGLLGVAHEEFRGMANEDWSVTRAVEAARRIDQLLEGVDSGEAAWKRRQGAIHGHIQVLHDRLLERGYPPSVAHEDDLVNVMVPLRGRLATTTEVRDEFVNEITNRRELLNAREREVLENHLLGEIASHLHDRIRSGESWVRDINQELDERPMSTGMKLRFAWQTLEDGPEELPEARKRLIRAPVTWSPADREVIVAFLQRQIETTRAQNISGTWHEHLSKAFDYRRWHQFHVERYQDGQWKRLTRRTHGTGSGGEKAIALTIPQFAAAAAHYRSADPFAPRLILLDEAFVGVDSDMRAKSLGLLSVFDLDLVMTSEREWGCYPTIEGLAIYQLSTRPGFDAVLTTRWTWNGRERNRTEPRRLVSKGSIGPIASEETDD